MESENNSEIIIFFVGGTLVLLLLALAIVMLTVIHSRRLYKKQLVIQELQLKHQQELLDHYITATEEERKRLATDLHDDVGTRLSSFRMSLIHTEDGKQSAGLRTEIDDIIQNVRNISHDIMPASIELFGLSTALHQLAESLNRTGRVMFHTDVEETTGLSNKSALAVYRIVQELMNNTLKHSGATEAHISCVRNLQHLTLDYSDNGIGMQQKENDGLGLRSIENRARMINAIVQWNNDATTGMAIKIEIPLSTDEQ